jgi:hypothetical protein
MQRQYNVGLNSVTKSISQVVDKHRYPPTLTHRGPERAWPSGTGSGHPDLLHNRRNNDNLNFNNKKNPPKYMPAFTTDVSHLVV